MHCHNRPARSCLGFDKRMRITDIQPSYWRAQNNRPQLSRPYNQYGPYCLDDGGRGWEHLDCRRISWGDVSQDAATELFRHWHQYHRRRKKQRGTNASQARWRPDCSGRYGWNGRYFQRWAQINLTSWSGWQKLYLGMCRRKWRTVARLTQQRP